MKGCCGHEDPSTTTAVRTTDIDLPEDCPLPDEDSGNEHMSALSSQCIKTGVRLRLRLSDRFVPVPVEGCGDAVGVRRDLDGSERLPESRVVGDERPVALIPGLAELADDRVEYSDQALRR